MRALALAAVVAACGDPYNGRLTPEQAAKAPEGHLVAVVGTVFATSWDSTEVSMHSLLRAAHAGDITWTAESEDESPAARDAPYDDTENYHRTPDHYVLVRSVVPSQVVQGNPDFTPGALAAAWGLGVHLTDIDPSDPMPEIGSTVTITGTLHHVVWNSREITLPVVDDPTITVNDGPPPLAGPGDACTRDTQCNARLVCDRASMTCMPPPREIYWDDPWRDVNGTCDTDADCPLGQICDQSHTIAATGPYAAYYFPTRDAGRHQCTLAAGATVASECGRVYLARDLVGARFASGKEICVHASLLTQTVATDGDTHDELLVDEPIPYPTDDIAYNLFGAVTENGQPYKDPTLPGGAVTDPQVGQDVIAIGTYRYDPGHGWYEIHPVKAYFPPP